MYDGQCEGSRALYIHDLMLLSRNYGLLCEAALVHLLHDKEYNWNLTQLFDLALILAQSGDNAARSAIYKRFSADPDYGENAILAVTKAALLGAVPRLAYWFVDR